MNRKSLNEKDPINLITFILIGNLALLMILLYPKSYSNYEFIKVISFMILFFFYYIAILFVFTYYIEKFSPVLTNKIKKHPIASKRIFALIGIFILFFILKFFMDIQEVWKIYGVAIISYLLSLIIPSNTKEKN